ncbi:MAG: DUF167 domain-containing protein [Candidatus Bathyarchaeia archaeon]
MKLMQTSKGVVLEIKVRPRSNKFRIQQNDEFTVFCKEAPVKGHANRTIEKELTRLFKRKVAIASGFNARKKRVLIEKTSIEEVEHILATF